MLVSFYFFYPYHILTLLCRRMEEARAMFARLSSLPPPPPPSPPPPPRRRLTVRRAPEMPPPVSLVPPPPSPEPLPLPLAPAPPSPFHFFPGALSLPLCGGPSPSSSVAFPNLGRSRRGGWGEYSRSYFDGSRIHSRSGRHGLGVYS